MKAFISIKYHADHRNRERIQEISSALEESGYQTTCIARDVEKWGGVQFSPETLMARTFEEINSSDLVVIDLTEKGVGVGIEAGYAYAVGVPLVVIARKGADISKTLQGISRAVFWYEGWDELRGIVRLPPLSRIGVNFLERPRCLSGDQTQDAKRGSEFTKA